MLEHILTSIKSSLQYAKSSPHLFFALVIVIILPLAFLYSGQRFLEVGKANQERLQKDRVGTLHDVFSTLLQSNPEIETLQEHILEVSALNPDITKFRIVRYRDNEFVPIVALDESVIGNAEEEVRMYRNSLIHPDEAIIFKFSLDESQIWQVVRFVTESEAGDIFILTEHNFAQIQNLFTKREQEAYTVLAIIYVLILLLAFWHIKSTDYQKLYLQAKTANETKDLFTNMIAHELRAPLTAIKGYASMLQEKPTTDDSQLYSERILLSSERLINIVNDLLDVARIQSGKLAVSRESVDVREVVESVVSELQISVKEKGITLQVSGSNNPHVVNADQKRLHQAVTNLVSNAIKYTTEGTIDISLSNLHTAVELRIKDTGMGISADDQKKLFAPFFRVHSTDVSNITGSGLGMWITKQLIELMGASIAVESIKGVGTHIVVKLPVDHRQQ